ncbi:hypothetical protein HKX48_000226 [Thoreauomyces humboldtii]|nr:hypothetical protein HKX48_000226 [Thoreauomyces humboldtii]
MSTEEELVAALRDASRLRRLLGLKEAHILDLEADLKRLKSLVQDLQHFQRDYPPAAPQSTPWDEEVPVAISEVERGLPAAALARMVSTVTQPNEDPSPSTDEPLELSAREGGGEPDRARRTAGRPVRCLINDLETDLQPVLNEVDVGSGQDGLVDEGLVMKGPSVESLGHLEQKMRVAERIESQSDSDSSALFTVIRDAVPETLPFVSASVSDENKRKHEAEVVDQTPAACRAVNKAPIRFPPTNPGTRLSAAATIYPTTSPCITANATHDGSSKQFDNAHGSIDFWLDRELS